MGVDLIKDNLGEQHVALIDENYNNDDIIEKNLEAYDILKILGRGENNCLTKKTHSKINNKIYTMKEIKINLLSEEKRNNLIHILNKLKNIECPNIVKNIIYFENNDYLYIIDEFVENGDLQDYFKTYKNLGKPIPEEILWNIFMGCISCLKFIHSQNIIHRDIRLENFLISEDQLIKLGNFKNAILCKEKQNNINNVKENDDIQNEEERFHDQVGGVLYRSPEMYNLNYGMKTDIYSLGVVFHKLCYNDFPISSIYLKNKKSNENYYSKEMKDIIELMLNEEKNRPNADKLYDLIFEQYIQKVPKITSIEAVFRCLNSYKKFNNYFENNSNNFQNKEKTPISFNYIKYKEEFKLNNDKKTNSLYLNNIRNLLNDNYNQVNNDEEINPILVLDFILEEINKETNENVNGSSLKIQPIEYSKNKKEIYDKYHNYLNNNYKSIISKLFVGFLNTKRTCINCKECLYNYSLFPFIEFNLDKCFKKNNNIYEYEPNVEKWFLIQQEHNKLLSEKQNIFCEVCKCVTSQYESKIFENFPNNLIIVINRGEGYNNKSKVIYSLTMNLGGLIFELVGVVKRITDKNGEYFISINLHNSNPKTWIISKRNKITKINNPINHSEGLVVLLFYSFQNKI